MPHEQTDLKLPRVIGGRLRGRKLLYSGDPRTRPMKDRTREALFNLIGPEIKGCHAIDLFAGTGALGIEAISRGAARATFVEQHFPTARLIGQNLAELQIEANCTVEPGNTFIWARRKPPLGDARCVFFCSPPYAFYVDRKAEMLELIGNLLDRAPAESIFAVEADERFDFAELPLAERWDRREYPPAHVGLLRV